MGYKQSVKGRPIRHIYHVSQVLLSSEIIFFEQADLERRLGDYTRTCKPSDKTIYSGLENWMNGKSEVENTSQVGTVVFAEKARHIYVLN